MKRRTFKKTLHIITFIFVTFFALSCAHAPTSDNSDTDLPTSSFMKVEWTLGGDLAGSGSGFVVKQALTGSLILTAEHVCTPSLQLLMVSILENKPVKLQVRSYDGLVRNAKVLKLDKKQDLCLIYSEGMHRPAVTFADDVPKVGGEIYVIGAPQGFSSDVDGLVPIIPGIYNGFISMGKKEKTDRFQTYTARISPGNSGGMVVNKFGEVVGNTNFVWFMRYGYADICGGSRLSAIKTFLKTNI